MRLETRKLLEEVISSEITRCVYSELIGHVSVFILEPKAAVASTDVAVQDVWVCPPPPPHPQVEDDSGCKARLLTDR